MKKALWVLSLMLLVSLTACRQKAPEESIPSEPPVEEPQPGPLELESLRIEIPRGDLGTARLAAAVQELPALLQEYFSATQSVSVKTVKLTVGSSPAATAQAVMGGTVDLAFLPAADFVEYGGGTVALLGNGTEEQPGTRSLICAAPTQYGKNLSQRFGEKDASWKEINHARWGVLEPESLEGYRCLDLWLSDHYEGNRIGDLSSVTSYDSYEALFRAAAAEEIDAFVIRDDARELMEDVWALSADRTTEGGMRGFDRTESIWDETVVMAQTERIYTTVAAVTDNEKLTERVFAEALAQVLDRLSKEQPERLELFGAETFTFVSAEDLNATRRLTTIG